VSYLVELGRELGAVGIRGRLRGRILAEADDHLRSDPEALGRFGSAREIANGFAAELGTQAARRASFGAFAALAVAGGVYAAGFIAVWVTGQPSSDSGLASLALWTIVVAPQVSFVAGALALLRSLRNRRAVVLPTAELIAINRRTAVALAAGIATMGGLTLYAIVLRSELAGWCVTFVLAAAPAAAALLALAAFPAAGAVRYRPRVEGAAGDLFDDLGLGRTDPWRFARRVALAVALVVWLQAAVQGDPLDGVVIAAFEAAACLGGFAVLGRYLALRR
jgi:hypothetical protein